MSRQEFSKAVRRLAFKRSDGRCEAILDDGTRCNCALTIGKFAFDHIIPDQLGGEPTLENCQALCSPCHTHKTRQDVADIAKAKRREDAHNGIRRPSKLQGQGFRKFAPAHRATKPVDKLAITYRRQQ